MGLRFRKSFSLGSLFRVNLSKSGVSLGVGPRGFNANFGPRGVRKTIGIPGTGLYYQETSSYRESAPQDVSAGESHSSSIWILLALGILIVVVAVNLGGGSTTSGSKNLPINSPKTVAQAPRPSATLSKPDRLLNRDEVRELQTLLRKQGFDTGAPDGIIGAKTQAAAQSFIRARRLDAQGASSFRVLEAARVYRK